MFSRLLGLGRSKAKAHQEPAINDDATAGQLESAAARPVSENLRVGLDFGTSTTLVSVRADEGEPRVLQLESTGNELPSYLAIQEGRLIFGEAAVNAGVNAHSVKLALRDDEPIGDLEGMRPTEAAFELIAEALRRALEQLKREGRMPPAVERLTVAANVGCTAAFTLEQRLRLRDVCRASGLDVNLVNLIEEPVAAAFEVAVNAAVPDGPTLVIDMGGGTLDVSVLEVMEHGTRFVLHASSGCVLGGDAFTEVIVKRMKDEMAALRGVDVQDLGLSGQQNTAIWVRAEAAKIALSGEESIRVVLPNEHSTELVLRRDWFEAASKKLVDHVVDFTTHVYQRARLTLHRELSEDDQRPGTAAFLNGAGHIKKEVRQFRLRGDAQEHIDVVYLVGGASRMPLIRRRFEDIFGMKIFDVQVVGMEPTEAVVMGLARQQSMDRIELRNPNWAVEAEFTLASAKPERVEVYQPFAPLMSMRLFDTTALYKTTVPIPVGYRNGSVSMVFRPIVEAQGDRWDAVPIPDGADSISVFITLFGDVAVWAGNERIFSEHRAPFARSGDPGDWLPKSWRDRWREVVPEYDWRVDTK